jgi:hypothetical protein
MVGRPILRSVAINMASDSALLKCRGVVGAGDVLR